MPRRGPTPEVLQLAREAKRLQKLNTSERLMARLVLVKDECERGVRVAAKVKPEDIYTEIGISRATYFRHLRAQPDLLGAASVFISSPPKDGNKIGVSSSGDAKQPKPESEGELLANNTALRMQIAACKTFFRAMEMEIAEKKQEIKSLNVLAADYRRNETMLYNTIGQLCDKLDEHQISYQLDVHIAKPRTSETNHASRRGDGGKGRPTISRLKLVDS